MDCHLESHSMVFGHSLKIYGTDRNREITNLVDNGMANII